MTSRPGRVGKPALEAPSQKRWLWVAIVAGLAALIGLGVLDLQTASRRHDVEQAARDVAWRVTGPPCAPLAPIAFKSVYQLPQSTPYDAVLFRRLSGEMACTHLTDPIDGVRVRYPICKFNAPGYLAVSIGGKDQFFDLAKGAAAVSVVKGQVRCVVIPGFRM